MIEHPPAMAALIGAFISYLQKPKQVIDISIVSALLLLNDPMYICVLCFILHFIVYSAVFNFVVRR